MLTSRPSQRLSDLITAVLPAAVAALLTVCSTAALAGNWGSAKQPSSAGSQPGGAARGRPGRRPPRAWLPGCDDAVRALVHY